MHQQFICDDCRMVFDSPNSLSSHQQKFCTGSKYANLDTLTDQYTKLQQTKQPPKLPMSPNLKASQSQANRNQPRTDLDREYRQLLRQIGDRQDLRNRFQRQKMNAEEELASLQKKENELFVNARKKELDDLIRKREQMNKEEDQIQKQIRNFQKQQKEESRINKVKEDQDFVFREGREAGKLAMQRRLLEEKKREIEENLKKKRREEERVYKDLDDINDRPIFIPDFKKKEEVPRPKKTHTEPVPRQVPSPNNSYVQQTSFIKPPSGRQPQPQQYPAQSKINHARSIINPPMKDSLAGSHPSKGSLVSEVNDAYLKAALFAGEEKTLFESLNPKNKSDEDIFIESLVAQEYDALNLLARLPKDSELYAVKMKQFQEMTKMRQELKDKVQKVRLDKVKREFQMEKQMTDTQKNNLIWLDQNRRQMLNREVDILRNNQNARQDYQEDSPYQNPTLPAHSPALRHQQTSHQTNKNHKNNNLSGLPSIGNIPHQRAQSQQGRKGYKIVVRSVKNYVTRSPMCVRVMVMEEGAQNPKWSFTTKYHDDSASKDDRNPYNPGIKNRIDESGAIVFNEALQIGEDLQSFYNRRQTQLYLWIMLMEKDQTKLSNEPEIYLWYCLKLTHFGSIREGVFTLSLYHDNCPFPFPQDMNRIKGKANEQITVELTEHLQQRVDKAPMNPNKTGFSTSQRNGSATSIGRQAARNKVRTVRAKPSLQKINSLHNIKEQFFIENQQVSNFDHVKGSDPTSFDFKISAFRTLPSHIGPLKLQIRFCDAQGEQILDGDEILAQFGGDMYNPKVNYTKQIRKKEIPSSTVVLIKIMTINTLNYEPGFLGFCYIHLGFDLEGNILEQNEKEYLLMNGHFQFPIYWGNTNKYLSMEQLHRQSPPIPCSSILVSVGEAGMGAPPEYREGVFNTAFFQVDELEYRLFQEQVKRERIKTLDYVQGYFKFKGVDASSNKPEDLKKLLKQGLAFNSQNLSNLLRLQNMAEYSKVFGIQAKLDGVLVPSSQTNYYYFATVCIHPPASYYSKEKVDLQFIYKIDLASSLTSHLIFEQKAMKFFPEYSPGVNLIIELNRVKLSSSNQPNSPVETVAHTVLPLFDLEHQNPCVDVGYKEIKLFEGEFEKGDLNSLQKNAIRFYELNEGKKRGEFSIFIRVLNGYFQNQWSADKVGRKGKPLRSIFQNSKGFKSAQSGIVKVIEDTYGVQLR